MFLLAPVPTSLRAVVHRVAAYDERAGAPIRRRQAPVPTVTLVIGLGERLRVDGATVGSFLAGLTDTAAITEFHGHQAGVQVDLSPLGSLRLLGTPLRALGPLRPLDDLRADSAAGDVLAGLPERLADLPTWRARLDAVTRALTGLLVDSAVVADPEVARAWRLLSERAGRVPLDVLAADVGWSRRHLTRRFSAQVGIAPTTLARVLRFRRAADLLVPPPGSAPAPGSRVGDVAAACGYADHSHLAGDSAHWPGARPAPMSPNGGRPASTPPTSRPSDLRPGAPAGRCRRPTRCRRDR